MTREHAHNLMENKLRCVQRGNYCDRDCAKCPLVKDDNELIEAYGYVIKALEQQPCEDYISRQALLNSLEEPMNWTDSEAEIQEQRDYEGFVELVKSMPSVIPQIETCEDCISRQAVLDNAYAYGNGLEPEGYCVNVEDIQALPPVTPEPKMGHWNRVIDKAGHWVWECDKCGWQQRFNTNYCSDCGVKMEIEE